ncbi:MAG TPA: hypothetical protein VF316_14335 [Polyangiaceae bacterium]
MRFLLGPALAVLVSCGGGSDGASTKPVVADAGPMPDAAPPSALFEQLSISEIAVYQTVKIDVMKDGSSVDVLNAPIVAGKKGILRAWVSPKPKKAWHARALDAELHLSNAAGEQVLVDHETLAGASDDDVLASTFDFPFDPSTLTPDTRYALWVRDPKLVASGGDKLGAIRFPTGTGATETLAVSSNPGPIKIKIVPVDYEGWLPDTSPTQLDRYRAELLDLYPAATVELSVRAPMVSKTLDWGEVLSQIAQTRSLDAPAADVYYVGAFVPGATYADYVKNGALAGLAWMSSMTCVILGYAGTESVTALAHELGHDMGRAHAPCGNPAGVDELYPYDGAALGVNGWSTSLQQLVPESESDVMSYCQPTWVSDYTYAALDAHIRAMYAQKDTVGSVAPERFRRIWIGADGAMRDGGIVLESAPGGALTAVNVRTSSGSKVVTGFYYPLDHLPGGYVLVPADVGATEIRLPAITTSVLPLH